jgi:cytosine/adenosine deaminase-related metal-dependent hydrolase
LGWLRAGLPDVAGMDFTQWIRSAIYQPFQNLKLDWQAQFVESIEVGIQQLKAAGITTVGDISETGLSIQPLLNAGMHGIVYIEVSGHDPTQAEAKFQKMVDIVNTWRYKMRGKLKLGLAPHTPWSVSRELWKKVLDFSAKEKLPLCIHVAESAAEVQFLNNGTGPIKELYYPHMNFDAPQKTPIAYLEELGVLEQKPLLVHAVQVTNDDIALIKKYGCTVVHCPRSNLRLRCGRMPIEKFIEAEIPILLGTDSLVSSPSLNIFQELEFASALHYGKVDPKQLIEMTHGILPGMIDVS